MVKIIEVNLGIGPELRVKRVLGVEKVEYKQYQVNDVVHLWTLVCYCKVFGFVKGEQACTIKEVIKREGGGTAYMLKSENCSVPYHRDEESIFDEIHDKKLHIEKLEDEIKKIERRRSK